MTRHLAITMGDPAGIGPEIIVKAAARLKDRLDSGKLKLTIIGSGPALQLAEQQLGIGIEIPETGMESDWPNLCFIQADTEGEPILPGELSADGGRMAFKAIEKGVQLALSGKIGGIVTAPLNKEALNKAGFHYAGHTELLAELTGARGSVMMLAHGNMRVSHVTTHVALEDVPKRLTPERLRLVIDLTHKALKNLGIDEPRIAVTGLNPHAGESGAIGTEENDIIVPAVLDLQNSGMRIDGPFSADTAFHRPNWERYDAVISMYHDQALIPIKTVAFEDAVNVTLGLPIVRTSPDHGTAFDLAGTGNGSWNSMLSAMRLADRLTA